MARSFTSASSESINRANHLTTKVSSLTVTAWIYLNSNNIFQSIFFNGCDGGFGQGWGFVVDTDGKLKVLVPFVAFPAVSTTVLSTGQWYFVGMQRTSTTWSVFIGGVQNGSTGTNNPFSIDGNSDTTIGARKNTSGSLDSFFDGMIAEVCVWDNTLPTAMWQMMADGYSPLFIHRTTAGIGGKMLYKPLLGTRDPIFDYIDNPGEWTTTGTTNDGHPRIIYPRSTQNYSFASASITTTQTAQTKARIINTITRNCAVKANIIKRIETLKENFNDNSLDAAIWDDFSDANISETNQQLEIELPTTSVYRQIETVNKYSLLGSYFSVQVVSAGDQSYESHSWVIYARAETHDNKIYISIADNLIICHQVVSGSDTNIGDPLSYDPDIHQFVRMREQGGQTHFEYSTDNINWSNIVSPIANPINLGLLAFGLQAGKYQTEAAGSIMVFDNVNVFSISRTTTTKARIKKPGVQPAFDWLVEYDANELPENATPAWTKSGSATTIENSPAGFLHVVSSALGSLAYSITNQTVDFTSGITLEARMKIVAGETSDIPTYEHSFSRIIISQTDGAKWIQLYFWSDGVAFVDDAGTAQFHAVDTSAYHTYRITATDDIATLYIDDISVLTVAPYIDGFYDGVYWSTEELGVANMESSWDYVYFTLSGAYSPAADTEIQAKARIKAVQIKTATARARIASIGNTVTVESKARIKKLAQIVIAARSRIRISNSQTTESIARVKKIELKDINSAARIKISEEITISSIGRILNNRQNNISSRARIGSSVNKDISAKGRIEGITGKIISAKASVKQTVFANTSALGRILLLKSISLLSKGRITNTEVSYVQVKARIKETQSKQVVVLSRLKVAVEQKIYSKARIGLVRSESVDSKAFIRAFKIKTVYAIGNIRSTNQQIINSFGRIKQSREELISANAHILHQRIKTIASKGNISGSIPKTIQAKANILIKLIRVVEIIDKIRGQRIVNEITYNKVNGKEISSPRMVTRDIVYVKSITKEISYTKITAKDVTPRKQLKLKWATAKARISS